MPAHRSTSSLSAPARGRLSDLREAAKFVKDKQVATGVRALAMPGSQKSLAKPSTKASTRFSMKPDSNGVKPAQHVSGNESGSAFR